MMQTLFRLVLPLLVLSLAASASAEQVPPPPTRSGSSQLATQTTAGEAGANSASTGLKEKNLKESIRSVRFEMDGWSEGEHSSDMRVWHGPDGSVLSLSALTTDGLTSMQNAGELQAAAREIATSQSAGLIEVNTVPCGSVRAVRLIYKRLQMPAYVFTGMLVVPGRDGSLVWTVVAGETGTTGMREAAVTTELMNAGKLNLQDYERVWAQDPYDKNFAGVDRSVLRFMSDDEKYDSQFPDHPLSRVRMMLTWLCNSTQVKAKSREP